MRRTEQASSAGASEADVLAATGLSDAQWNGAIAALLAEGRSPSSVPVAAFVIIS
ncbi:hypothetical protein [Halochromatium roseum]|uniref:hypothetical protein n=1 Tax=Halochromatium roseum TaxID=391920 RepID=UPI001913F781|nr:hypothetical protein [Halochromatium roseum]